MFKLIILVVGLGLGFCGGVYYGVNHPSDAAAFDAARRAGFQKVEIKAEHLMDNSQPSSSESK